MRRGFFVTGTDTGCGKTEITLGLMRQMKDSGYRTLGMKPVASGAVPTAAGLRNEDASRIRAESSTAVPYERVNPYAFEPPIAPHLAAQQAGVSIRLETILQAYQWLAAQGDCTVVEGVGGWRVPLAAGLSVSDLPQALQLPVILVVGLRLGCINHALLSAEAILATGVELVGWVANHVDPDMLIQQENLQSLKALMPAPCVGEVPFLAQPDTAAVSECLTL
ncbi:dethiobiotin synthetase [Candidatus Endoriftia persephone str. Guaymas]|uniref:ATP-dependent dethiobiotin synthetase BioD n=3 Tax=Gammaproteobacteria TaxID=1236 RepID=G2FB00_9GAMM|nr:MULTISPECIES: dethiobiotin synthase [sulfur-oxidizing symbionts]EGW55938.1 dethiobiotin synthase [endosymbiont of Tevnia jerichonana (vent Tica)]MBA1330825.1 dethiobiotin synthetase [Candidatus Endoriftia persephone str. Guaymas]USF89188.1 dethiobiotin synthase [Candidatus Endoriftia persephone]